MEGNFEDAGIWVGGMLTVFSSLWDFLLINILARKAIESAFKKFIIMNQNKIPALVSSEDIPGN